MKRIRIFRVIAVLILSSVLFSGFSRDIKLNKPIETERGIIAVIGNVTAQNVTRDSLSQYDVIRLVSTKIKPEILAKYTIVKYTIATAPKYGQSRIEPEAFGCGISKKIREHISKSNPGDMIIITSATVKDPEGKLYMTGGSTYVIIAK